MTTPTSASQQILTALGRIETNTQEIKLTVAGIQADLANVKQLTARLETTVYGNGSPGLKETTALHEQRIDCVEEAVTQLTETGERLKKIEAALASAEAERLKKEQKQEHIEDEQRHAKQDTIVDYRKFYLGVAAAILTGLITIVLELIQH